MSGESDACCTHVYTFFLCISCCCCNFSSTTSIAPFIAVRTLCSNTKHKLFNHAKCWRERKKIIAPSQIQGCKVVQADNSKKPDTTQKVEETLSLYQHSWVSTPLLESCKHPEISKFCIPFPVTNPFSITY